MISRKQFDQYKKEKRQTPETPPFTRWVTFGDHMYRSPGERCDVEFVDKGLGIRKVIVDNKGNIIAFPGIEKGDWMKFLSSSQYLKPVIRFRTDFKEYDNAHYIMIWEVQPEGRYWEDEDGFGGTSDLEVRLYALIDHAGCFTGPFRIYSIDSESYR